MNTNHPRARRFRLDLNLSEVAAINLLTAEMNRQNPPLRPELSHHTYRQLACDYLVARELGLELGNRPGHLKLSTGNRIRVRANGRSNSAYLIPEADLSDSRGAQHHVLLWPAEEADRPGSFTLVGVASLAIVRAHGMVNPERTTRSGNTMLSVSSSHFVELAPLRAEVARLRAGASLLARVGELDAVHRSGD